METKMWGTLQVDILLSFIHIYIYIYIYIYIGIHSFLCSKYYRIKSLRLKLHKQGQHEHWKVMLMICILDFFFEYFFDVDHFFKVFIEYFTIFLLFYVLDFWPLGMWDLSSPSRNQTHTLGIGRWSLNHWTARKVPLDRLYRIFLVRTKPSKTCKSPTSNKYPIITAARDIFMEPQQRSWYHLLTNSPYTTIKPEKL